MPFFLKKIILNLCLLEHNKLNFFVRLYYFSFYYKMRKDKDLKNIIFININHPNYKY